MLVASRVPALEPPAKRARLGAAVNPEEAAAPPGGQADEDLGLDVVIWDLDETLARWPRSGHVPSHESTDAFSPPNDQIIFNSLLDRSWSPVNDPSTGRRGSRPHPASLVS